MEVNLFSRIAVSGMAIVIVSVVLRVFLVLSEIHRHRRRRKTNQTLASPTLIVLGSGGHTTEMLFMTKCLSRYYHPIQYCKAVSDTTSADRLWHALPKDTTVLPKIHDIPRSREVGQSYVTSVFTTLYSLGAAFCLVWKTKPRLILCNGPGTCIPICMAALCFRIFLGRPCQIVFIESYCRVQTLSLTGKILYYVADLFCVHWKQLHEKYPNSVMSSSFIKAK